MTDIASIAGAISSVKTALDIAKFIKDADYNLEKAEFKMKLAELMSSLADIKMQISESQQIIFDQNKLIDELRIKKKLRDGVFYQQPSYYLKTETGKDGPYCQACYDGDEKLIRLQSFEQGYWMCNICSKNYQDETFVKRAAYTPSDDYDDDF